MNYWLLGGLFFLGLCMGSFVNALVWRLKEKRNWVSDRSECVHCHHKLAAIDLIPVVSWLALRGKCRYCKKPISVQYPLVELLVGALFAASFLWWPLAWTGQWHDVALFGLWLAAVVLLIAALLYDLKWGLLPDVLTYPLAVIGLLFAVIRFVTLDTVSWVGALEVLAGLLPIAGFYGALWLASKGKWVGLGDAKLGIFLGLVLGWQLALMNLILANLIGTLIVLPALLAGKLNRQSRVPFGPFLIIAFFVVFFFGPALLDWYLQTMLIGI